jgi:hypothetical protein
MCRSVYSLMIQLAMLELSFAVELNLFEADRLSAVTLLPMKMPELEAKDAAAPRRIIFVSESVKQSRIILDFVKTPQRRCVPLYMSKYLPVSLGAE